ncbi:hypothetical protein AbraIFM66950_000220 [Aspergillus brasiliensis]|nr:hypothetical protein AbraIFM66950_000220 [Aspergillus brasiliensis]
MFQLLLLLSCLTTSLANAKTIRAGIPSNPSVTVRNGTYYGLHNEHYNQDFFLGMPYALQPVGDLRLQTPQSLNTSWSSARNATQYSPACVGFGQTEGASEACLTLNVIRPGNTSTHDRLPVAVWIYGGGFTSGSSSDPQYNLSYIVDQSVQMGQPMIAVSLNYRLHCWGFMWGKEIKEAGVGNLGLRDQRLALHWINENIAAFGGDPTQVTIWGESAGANSVGTQLVAYGGRDDGLFRAAISESAAPSVYQRYSTPADWQPYYDAIVTAAGCSSATDTLACLRTIPTDTLHSIFDNTSIVPAHSISGLSGATFTPVIDDDFIAESATIQLQEGKFVKVPYLIGANNDEGTTFALTGINTDAEFAEKVVKGWGLDNITTEILEALYPDIPEIGIPEIMTGRPPAQFGKQYKRVAAFQGDTNIHAPRRLTSRMWAYYNVTAYSYRFDAFNPAYGPSAGSYAGSTHGVEIPYVFYNLDKVGDGENDTPNAYSDLSKIMSRMWVSFVTNLDPNYYEGTNPHWPAYNLDNPEIIFFNTSVPNGSYAYLDIYRAEGIKYISDHLADAFGR